MLSGSLGKKLYLVAVRYGDEITEHVCDTECDTFTAAALLAGRVRRWLSEGTGGHHLPASAADLRRELEAAGYDPRTDVRVLAVRLGASGPGLWDCRPEKELTIDDPPVTDDDDADDDDTPLVLPELPAVRVRTWEGR